MPGLLDRLRGVFGARGKVVEKGEDLADRPISDHGQTPYDRLAPMAHMAYAMPNVLRQVLLSVCEAALAQSGLDHPLANEALEAVREGRALSPYQRQQLVRLAQERNTRCFELWQPGEDGHATDEEWRVYFTQARAAGALWFATSDSPIENVQEALYEAWHATYRGDDIPDTAYSKSGLQAYMTRATPEVQRQVLPRACEVALAQSGLDHPVASEALEALREGKVLSPERRGQVRRLVAELDARHFELQDLAQAGNVTDEDWKAYFQKARAASALWFATSDNPVESAQQTLYDAWLATDCGSDVPDLLARE